MGDGISTEEEISRCHLLTTSKTMAMLEELKRAWAYGKVAFRICIMKMLKSIISFSFLSIDGMVSMYYKSIYNTYM